MKRTVLFSISLLLPVLTGCNRSGTSVSPSSPSSAEELVSLKDVAVLLSSVELGSDRVREVFDAVSVSEENGYDEEYTMKDLFSDPGKGVGQDYVKSSTSEKKSYTRPLRDVFYEYYSSMEPSSKAGMTGKEYLDYISNSDMQIYWPFSDKWDGQMMPVLTFDPVSEVSVNEGYYMDTDGKIKTIAVTEELARQRPVWVVNRNTDAEYQTLEIMLKNHPEWQQGGNLHIGYDSTKSQGGGVTKAPSDNEVRTLVLKDFTAKRQYDSWFRGASEFFIKMGSVESFTASTEAELYLYNPSITDFMIVVKRKEVGIVKNLNTVLVSEWTSQLDKAALMIIEDDGGTVTSWSCSAVVKYNSKSFGFDLQIPYRSRDNIVWRGQLSRKYIEANNDVTGCFGDVTLTFSLINSGQ